MINRGIGNPAGIASLGDSKKLELVDICKTCHNWGVYSGFGKSKLCHLLQQIIHKSGVAVTLWQA